MSRVCEVRGRGLIHKLSRVLIQLTHLTNSSFWLSTCRSKVSNTTPSALFNKFYDPKLEIILLLPSPSFFFFREKELNTIAIEVKESYTIASYLKNQIL